VWVERTLSCVFFGESHDGCMCVRVCMAFWWIYTADLRIRFANTPGSCADTQGYFAELQGSFPDIHDFSV